MSGALLAIVDAQGLVARWHRRSTGRAVAGATAEFLQQVLQQPFLRCCSARPRSVQRILSPSFYVARPVLRGRKARWLAVVQVQAALLTPVLMQSVDIAGLHVSLVRDDGAALLSVPARSSPGLLPTPLQAGAHWGRSWPRKRATSVGTRSLTLHVAQPTMYPQLWVSARLLHFGLGPHLFDRGMWLLVAALAARFWPPGLSPTIACGAWRPPSARLAGPRRRWTRHWPYGQWLCAA